MSPVRDRTTSVNRPHAGTGDLERTGIGRPSTHVRHAAAPANLPSASASSSPIVSRWTLPRIDRATASAGARRTPRRILDPVLAAVEDLRRRPAASARRPETRPDSGSTWSSATATGPPGASMQAVVAVALTVPIDRSFSRPPFACTASRDHLGGRIDLPSPRPRPSTRRFGLASGQACELAGRPSSPAAPCRRRSAEPEIEVRERDPLELIEADAGQLLGEHGGVADQHDRQPIGMQVLLRDPLNVVGRDRVDAIAKGLQLFEIEAEEDRVEHLQRDRARRLDRQRKAAGQIGLRVGELARRARAGAAGARTRRRSAAALRRSSPTACPCRRRCRRHPSGR